VLRFPRRLYWTVEVALASMRTVRVEVAVRVNIELQNRCSTAELTRHYWVSCTLFIKLPPDFPASRLITAWNERQAQRMPMLFSPTIGAAVAARFWFLRAARILTQAPKCKPLFSTSYHRSRDFFCVTGRVNQRTNRGPGFLVCVAMASSWRGLECQKFIVLRLDAL
jgi:hypothetical protein